MITEILLFASIVNILLIAVFIVRGKINIAVFLSIVQAVVWGVWLVGGYPNS